MKESNVYNSLLSAAYKDNQKLLGDLISFPINDTESFLNFLDALWQKFKGNFYSGRQHILAQNIAQQENTFVYDILDKLENDDREFSDSYLFECVRLTPHLELSDKLKFSYRFLNSEDKRIFGLLLLSHCLKNEEINAAEKAKGLQILLKSTESDNSDEKTKAAFEFCELSVSYSYLREKLLELKRRDDFFIENAISRFLLLHEKDILEDEFFKTLFSEFSNTKCKSSDAIQNIDVCLYDLWKTDKKFVISFLIQWIKHSDYPLHSKNFCNIFSCLFSAVDKSDLSYMATKFFLEDDSVYHKAASDILYEAHIKKDLLQINEEIIKDCNADDIVFFCRKILGYLFEIEQICKFFISIVKVKIDDSEICRIMLHTFCEILVPDYPNFLEDFFKNEKKNNVCSNEILFDSFCNKVLDYCRQYINFIELSKSNEKFPDMQISYENAIEWRKRQIDFQEEIRKQSEEKSIMSKLATNTFIKYGKGCCFYVEGRNMPTNPFWEFSEKFSVPNKEIFCPVDNEMKRYLFRTAKRGEK